VPIRPVLASARVAALRIFMETTHLSSAYEAALAAIVSAG
jgi:hypothetical protein